MYEAYFHLQASPFPATPIVANYFPSQSMEAARQSLIRVIERAEGPGFIVGPAGVGKSLLLRVLAEHFGEVFRVALLSGARVTTRKSLLQSILYELGMPYRGMDEGELRLGLIDALRPAESCPNGILLLIDEAHTLNVRLLDEVRMMTNVVRDGQPRARLVLAGGPRLEERFANHKLESFSQRLAARCYLQPFSRDETNEYIRAQLSWAGGNPDAILGADVARAVYQASDGVPRLVNQICDHALLLAQTNDITVLTAAMIQDAWADLQQLPPPWQSDVPPASTTENTVIEFGELPDPEPHEDPVFSSELSSELSSEPCSELSSEPCIEPCSEPCSSEPVTMDWPDDLHEEYLQPTYATLDESLLQTSVLVGLPDSEVPVEWCLGELPEEPEPVESLATNPFEGHFEEEVTVVDRFAASEIEAFRGRVRVSCPEGRRIIAELTAAFAEAPNQQQQADVVQPTYENEDLAPAFEFSTFQEFSMNMPPQELAESHAEYGSQAGNVVEFDLEDELASVPLPWTRERMGDDRDLIVIEDDLPAMNVFSEETQPEAAHRRVVYRELFAQLRGSSS